MTPVVDGKVTVTDPDATCEQCMTSRGSDWVSSRLVTTPDPTVDPVGQSVDPDATYEQCITS